MSNNDSAALQQLGYKQELKRELGFWDVFIYGVGMMMPIAPIVVFGSVTMASLGHMALAYLIAVIPMSFTAYSYGQMAGAYPVAGSAFGYTQRAIHPYAGFFAGWTILLDYALFPILNYIVIGIFTQMLFPSLNYWVIAIISIVLVTIVNLLGVKNVSRVNAFLVVFMFIAVIYFVGASFNVLGAGTGWGFTSLPFYNPESFKLSALLMGTSIACFSFMGFDAMTTLAEEVREPAKTLSKATISVCFFMAVVFILQAYCAQSVFPDWTKFQSPDSAFMEAAGVAGGNTLFTVLCIAMIAGAVANAIDSQAGVARVLYGMGRDEVLPKKIFAYLHPKTRVPAYTIIILAVIAVVGASQDMGTIITMINFGALTAFMFVNLSVIAHYYIKEHRRSGAETFKYLIVPALGFVTCFLLFISLSTNAKIAGTIWVSIGILYILFSTKFFTKPFKEIKAFESVDD
ncbi:MAG: APC family permease [Methylocystaceae bacterium]